jgi:hypothetical protein
MSVEFHPFVHKLFEKNFLDQLIIIGQYTRHPLPILASCDIENEVDMEK